MAPGGDMGYGLQHRPDRDRFTDPDMMFSSSLGLDVTMAPGGGRAIGVML